MRAALAQAGHAASADGLRVLPGEVRTAAQAAAALGVEVGAIANSLVLRAHAPDEPPDGATPLLALTSGAHRADLRALAAQTGAERVEMADPAFVREHTGQAIGGVAPLGHPRPLPTLVDTALRLHPVVWAAGGHARAVFPTSFDALLALTGGRAADVAGRDAA